MLSSFPKTAELIQIAKRVVWFKDPLDTLNNPIHFMSYLMTYGFYEDVKTVKKYATEEDFLAVLECAPPGVFDPRSWAYWNLMCNRLPIPAMPTRKFGE